MKTRLFDIVTLSSNHSRLADPATILTAGVAVLTQLFPNIFGGNRKKLTESDWLQLLPGAGYWTTSLRNYLKAHITYDVDYTNNIIPFTKYFVDDNKNQICGGSYTDACYSKFLGMLDTEKKTGGMDPVGITPGGYGGTVNYSTLMPLAIGAIALVFLMKSKKKA